MRADERTILIAHDELLGKMLANVAKPEAGPAAKRLAQIPGSPDVAVVVALDPIRPMLKAELQKAPGARAVRELPDHPGLDRLGGGPAQSAGRRGRLAGAPPPRRGVRQAARIPAERLIGYGQNGRADAGRPTGQEPGPRRAGHGAIHAADRRPVDRHVPSGPRGGPPEPFGQRLRPRPTWPRWASPSACCCRRCKPPARLPAGPNLRTISSRSRWRCTITMPRSTRFRRGPSSTRKASRS